LIKFILGGFCFDVELKGRDLGRNKEEEETKMEKRVVGAFGERAKS